MMRTASILLETSSSDAEALLALQSAYAEACSRLVPVVIEHRCWNRVALHQKTYSMLKETSPLGSQMKCNAIYSVCKAYRSQKELGRIRKNEPVPVIQFKRASVHFDRRTYTIKGDVISQTADEPRFFWKAGFCFM